MPRDSSQFHSCALSIPAGTTAVARVRAHNSVGSSEWSAPTCVHVPLAPPPPPHGLALVAATSTSLRVSWAGVVVLQRGCAPVTSYTVSYRCARLSTAASSANDKDQARTPPTDDEGTADVHNELHIASDSCSISARCLSPEGSPRRSQTATQIPVFASAPATSDGGSCGTPSVHGDNPRDSSRGACLAT